MSGGLETSAYLALFGGNQDEGDEYWGNLLETGESRKYISETQTVLRSFPFSLNNLNRVTKAVERDLDYMLTERIASEISVTASIPALNTVKLVIDIVAEGQENSFEFTENWKAST